MLKEKEMKRVSLLRSRKIILIIKLYLLLTSISCAQESGYLSFPEFKQINLENFSSISSANISMKYEEYKKESQESLEMKLEQEKKTLKRLNRTFLIIHQFLIHRKSK